MNEQTEKGGGVVCVVVGKSSSTENTGCCGWIICQTKPQTW